MLPLKILHFIGILLIILQGSLSFNITKFNTTTGVRSLTLLVMSTTTEKAGTFMKPSQKPCVTVSVNLTETTEKISHLPKPVESSLDKSIIFVSLNSTYENITFDLVNDTFKSDYTTAGKITESSGSFWSLRPVDTAAIAAGIFLIVGVVGYGGCVIYRRYLQKKYGNGHILSHEEFYDITDLRYFEI